MSATLNYRHLYYFWVVGKEGGVARAAARLGVAVQTVGSQVRELENSLGCALLVPAGRGVRLSAAGIAAMRHAEQIFQLGEQLPTIVRDAGSAAVVRLLVGVSDVLPKLVVHRLMQPVLDVPNLHLKCFESSYDELLADLALHRLDVVLADRPPPPNPRLRVYGHLLGRSAIAWYAPAAHFADARREFPQSLARVPVLLPTPPSDVRAQLELWFERLGLRPQIKGEFEDSALLKTFGAGGMGVFPSAVLVEDELIARYQVRRVGLCDEVEERFFLIGAEKKIKHPMVQRLMSQTHV